MFLDDDERLDFKIKQCLPDLKSVLQKTRNRFKYFEDSLDYMKNV